MSSKPSGPPILRHIGFVDIAGELWSLPQVISDGDFWYFTLVFFFPFSFFVVHDDEDNSDS